MQLSATLLFVLYNYGLVRRVVHVFQRSSEADKNPESKKLWLANLKNISIVDFAYFRFNLIFFFNSILLLYAHPY